MKTPDNTQEEFNQLSSFKIACLFETTTLILLTLLAMPLKYLCGFQLAVQITGPIHGFAFLTYFFYLTQTKAPRPWTKLELTQLTSLAFCPFGGFFNLRLIRAKMKMLEAPKA